jgi:hypothetical protein
MDKDFIIENMKTMSLKEIADHLGADENEVKKTIDAESLKNKQDPLEANLERLKRQLKKETFWKTIKRQFRPAECDVFVENYIQTINQFEQTAIVLHTEKMQVVDLIRSQLLLDRS